MDKETYLKAIKPPEKPKNSPGLNHSGVAGSNVKYPGLETGIEMILFVSNAEKWSKIDDKLNLACYETDSVKNNKLPVLPPVGQESLQDTELQELIEGSNNVSGLHSYCILKTSFQDSCSYFRDLTHLEAITSYFFPAAHCPENTYRAEILDNCFS